MSVMAAVFIDRKSKWTTPEDAKKKCIFYSIIHSVPDEGKKIEVQGMVEIVTEVIHSFDNELVEITVAGNDDDNNFKEIPFIIGV